MPAQLQQLKLNLDAAVARMPPGQVLSCAPGKWCAAEVLEHLYLSYTGTITGLRKVLAEDRPLATRASMRHRLATFIVVGLRHMPAGRKTPAVAAPRGLEWQQVTKEIGPALLTMDGLLSQGEARFGRRKILDHPILGPLSASQWRTLHAVHGRHHLKQLQALARPAGASKPNPPASM